MALIVEDGTIITSANTYVDVDDVDVFCDDLGLTEWADAGDTEKEQAILRAMAFIEAQSFKGIKTDSDNPLKWPRDQVYDEDGYAIDTDVVPSKIRLAVCQAAYEEILSARCLQENLTKGISQETIDVISTSYFSVNVPAQTIYTAVMQYLKEFIKNTNMVELLRT